MGDIFFDRSRLIETLVGHQRLSNGSCFCGWGDRHEHIAASFAEHIADVYEFGSCGRIVSDVHGDGEPEPWQVYEREKSCPHMNGATRPCHDLHPPLLPPMKHRPWG